MIHIGTQTFYKKVTSELEHYDTIFIEGVGISKNSKLWDLFAHRIGLVAQEDSLKYPTSSRIINIDMKKGVFISKLFRHPIKQMIHMLFLRYILWFFTIKYTAEDWREVILKSLVSKYRKSNQSSDDKKEMRNLIMNERDKAICAKLETELQNILPKILQDHNYKIAVIFGANHTLEISKKIFEIGFRIISKKWYNVIDTSN